jgi:hypothetical protein
MQNINSKSQNVPVIAFKDSKVKSDRRDCTIDIDTSTVISAYQVFKVIVDDKVVFTISWVYYMALDQLRDDYNVKKFIGCNPRYKSYTGMIFSSLVSGDRVFVEQSLFQPSFRLSHDIYDGQWESHINYVISHLEKAKYDTQFFNRMLLGYTVGVQQSDTGLLAIPNNLAMCTGVIRTRNHPEVQSIINLLNRKLHAL